MTPVQGGGFMEFIARFFGVMLFIALIPLILIAAVIGMGGAFVWGGLQRGWNLGRDMDKDGPGFEKIDGGQ